MMWSNGSGRMILRGWLRADDSRRMIIGRRAQLLYYLKYYTKKDRSQDISTVLFSKKINQDTNE